MRPDLVGSLSPPRFVRYPDHLTGFALRCRQHLVGFGLSFQLHPHHGSIPLLTCGEQPIMKVTQAFVTGPLQRFFEGSTHE